jgi:type IV fimbrial biogenesis protein FimT
LRGLPFHLYSCFGILFGMPISKPIKGFTALELLVTMAVAAILLATAVPAFKTYSWNLRLKTAIDTLQTDLNLARSRAINMNASTVMCPVAASDQSSDVTCADVTQWQHGWMVFADVNEDRQRQPLEPILKRSPEIELVNISSSLARNALRFYPNGTAPGSNATLVFCDRRGAEFAGKISLSNSGRIVAQAGGITPRAGCL